MSFPRRFSGVFQFFVGFFNSKLEWALLTFVCMFFSPDIFETIGRLSKHSRCASASAGLS